MNQFTILYYRENNGEGEYVIFTEEETITDELKEDHELMGFHFESAIAVTTKDRIHNLPFERTLLKEN